MIDSFATNTSSSRLSSADLTCFSAAHNLQLQLTSSWNLMN